jgi:hypothetical protein
MWDKQLNDEYTRVDPHDTLPIEEVNQHMKTYIMNAMRETPAYSTDHEFVNSSCEWLDHEDASSMFTPYHERLLSDKAFALDGIRADAWLIRRFDLSSTPFYSELCMEAVTGTSWRVIRHVDAQQCKGMVDICTQSFQGGYAQAQAKRDSGRRNTYIIKYMMNTVVPIARSSGVVASVVDDWVRKLEEVKFD